MDAYAVALSVAIAGTVMIATVGYLRVQRQLSAVKRPFEGASISMEQYQTLLLSYASVTAEIDRLKVRDTQKDSQIRQLTDQLDAEKTARAKLEAQLLREQQERALERQTFRRELDALAARLVGCESCEEMFGSFGPITQNLNGFRTWLTNSFNRDELVILFKDMGEDLDAVVGAGNHQWPYVASEAISYMQRRGKIDLLIAEAKKRR